MQWVKKMLNAVRVFIISFHMDIDVQNLNWPAYVDFYCIFFGRWRVKGDIRPPGFPKTINGQGDTTGKIIMSEVSELVQKYRVDEVRLTIVQPPKTNLAGK